MPVNLSSSYMEGNVHTRKLVRPSRSLTSKAINALSYSSLASFSFFALSLERVMNSMRNGLEMRKTGERWRSDYPHSDAVFA